VRARNIKPGYFKNEVLGTIDPLAQLLFAGLWCLADRDGRLEDRPMRIRGEVFPYRNVDVNGLLTLLADAGLIIRYSAGQGNYLEVVKFKEHQNPHPHEAKSKIPERNQCHGMSLHVTKCTADSLIPDSLILKDIEVDAKTCPPPLGKKGKGKPRPPSGNHQIFIAWWCRTYRLKHEEPYMFDGKKDGRHVSDILKTFSLEEATLKACDFLMSEDPFYKGKHDLGTFRCHVNKFHAPDDGIQDRLRKEGIIPMDWGNSQSWLQETTNGG